VKSLAGQCAEAINKYTKTVVAAANELIETAGAVGRDSFVRLYG
jgi:hypothetical protein